MYRREREREEREREERGERERERGERINGCNCCWPQPFLSMLLCVLVCDKFAATISPLSLSLSNICPPLNTTYTHILPAMNTGRTKRREKGQLVSKHPQQMRIVTLILAHPDLFHLYTIAMFSSQDFRRERRERERRERREREFTTPDQIRPKNGH